jgi:hypothetical protein
VVSFTPRPLYPQGKSLRYPLDRRLGGPQSRSGRHGEEKNLGPTGTRSPTPSSSRLYPVAIPTELSRLCRGEEVVKISCGSVQSAHQEGELSRLVLDHGPSWDQVLALPSVSQQGGWRVCTSNAVWGVVLYVTAAKGTCAGSSAIVEKQLDISGPW